MTTDAAPVATAQRIVFWDVLRGVAVLGVLMANMPLMSLSRALDWQSLDLDHGRLDFLGFAIVRLVADTKFITTFSVLFGAGLALLAEKAAHQGGRFAGMYSRRLGVLALFGVAHITLLWFGDILLHYALWGFVAMLLRRLRPRTLAIVGFTLLVLVGAFNALLGLVDPAKFVELPPDQTLKQFSAARLGRFHDAFSSGDFAAMAAVRVELAGEAFFFMNVFWGARTLALFLLGIALVKSGIMRRPAEHGRFWRRCIAIGLTVGAPVQVLNLVIAGPHDTAAARVLDSATTYCMGLLLAPAYIGVVALWTQGDRWLGLQRRLAAVGRMAFTSYLSHSIITAAVFNYAGLYDRLDRFAGLGVTAAIFAFQLWISPLWLARFRFGPFEWVWRSATYLRWQPLRK